MGDRRQLDHVPGQLCEAHGHEAVTSAPCSLGQISTVRLLLTPGQERGEIRGDPPAEDLAAQLHSVLFGRTVEWIQRGTLKSEATEGILRHTLNTLEPIQQPVTCRLPDRKDRQAPNQLFR